MKKPKNDQEYRDLLKRLGRSDDFVDGIMDFGKLAKAMEGGLEEKFIKTANKMKKKWK